MSTSTTPNGRDARRPRPLSESTQSSGSTSSSMSIFRPGQYGAGRTLDHFFEVGGRRLESVFERLLAAKNHTRFRSVDTPESSEGAGLLLVLEANMLDCISITSDWRSILRLCEHISRNDLGARTYASLLKKKFRRGKSEESLAAAMLWGSAMNRGGHRFISQCRDSRFLRALDETFESQSTGRAVRRVLLRVVAGVAYDNRANAEDPYLVLWRQRKPSDAPNEGVPWSSRVEEKMFRSMPRGFPRAGLEQSSESAPSVKKMENPPEDTQSGSALADLLPCYLDEPLAPETKSKASDIYCTASFVEPYFTMRPSTRTQHDLG